MAALQRVCTPREQRCCAIFKRSAPNLLLQWRKIRPLPYGFPPNRLSPDL